MDITAASEAAGSGSIPDGRTIFSMRRPDLRLALAAVLPLLACGCAATKAWWYSETGRMTPAEAAAHGHPECAGLTLRGCELKAQKEAARTVPEGSRPGGQ
jgi:hypothetical protein